MAATFKALCDNADWSKKSAIKHSESIKQEEEQDKDTAPKESFGVKTADMNLHYNIQIHLPETTNMAVYDAIFQSLKKH